MPVHQPGSVGVVNDFRAGRGLAVPGEVSAAMLSTDKIAHGVHV